MKKILISILFLLFVGTTFAQQNKGTTVVYVRGAAPTITLNSVNSPTTHGGSDGSINVTAVPGVTYHWVKYPNTGWTTSTASISGLSSGTYILTASNTTCSVTDTVVLTDPPLPVITTQPAGQILCVGDALDLFIGATGTNLTYQWRRNGVDIVGATSATYHVATVATTDGGSYQCVVYSATGQTSSNLAQVTVKSVPVVNVPNTAVAYPATATLTANGGGSYVWNTGATTAAITVNPTTTTTYVVTVTNNDCSTTDDAIVTVTGGPLTVNSVSATPAGPICVGRTVQLSTVVTNGAPAYTYVWSNGATGNNISVTPNATTTYTVTVTDHYNATATNSITVMVNQPPTANAGGDQTIVFGDATTIGTPAIAGYTYAWGSTPAGLSSVSAEPIVSPTHTTTYTVTASNGGCTATDDVIVQVTGGPFEWADSLQPITSSLGTTINLGQSTTLTVLVSGGTPPYNYAWSNGGNTASIVVTPNVTTTYTVTVNDASRAQLVASTTVTVLIPNPPTASVGFNTQNQTICSGGNTSFAITLGGAKPWSVTYKEGTADVTINNINVSPYNVIVSPTVTTSYLMVSVTDSLGQTEDATGGLTVTVNPSPAQINLGVDQTICIGDGVTLGDQNGSTYSYYQWSNNASTATIAVTPSATTTYAVTATNAFMCSKIDTIKVTVNQLPVINAGANINICASDSAVITATGGSSYSWNPGAMIGATLTVHPTATTTYTVVGGGNGCFATDDVTVFVNALPTANAGADVTICDGSSTALTATGGGSYLWNTGSPSSTISVSPTSTTVYTVTVSTSQGCKATDMVAVTVSPLPTVDAGADLSVCAGNTTTFNIMTTGATQFSWSPATGLNDAAVKNPTLTPVNNTTYTVQVKNDDGCMANDQITVTVNPVPAVTASDVFTCEGDSIQLNAGSSVQNCSFAWSPVTNLTGATTPTPMFHGTITASYMVIATSPTIPQCSAFKMVTVTVNPLPVAEFSAMVSFDSSGVVTFTSLSSDATSFHWNFGDGKVSTEESPVHHYTMNGDFNVNLTATNGCGTSDVTHSVMGVIYIGIEELPAEVSNVSIYPNPTSGVLYLNNLENVEYFTILNSIGQTIHTQQIPNGQNSIQLNMDEYPSGMYILQLTTTKGNIFPQRVVKN